MACMPTVFLVLSLCFLQFARVRALKFLKVDIDENTKMCPYEEVQENLIFNASYGGTVNFPHQMCQDNNGNLIVRRCYENGTWEYMKNVDCSFTYSKLDYMFETGINPHTDYPTYEPTFEMTTTHLSGFKVTDIPWNNLEPVDILSIVQFVHNAVYNGSYSGILEYEFQILPMIQELLSGNYQFPVYTWDLLLEDIEILTASFRANYMWSSSNLNILTNDSYTSTYVTYIDSRFQVNHKDIYFDQLYKFRIETKNHLIFTAIEQETSETPMVLMSEGEPYFRTKTAMDKPTCVLWQYPTDIHVITGKWVNISDAIVVDESTNLYKCDQITGLNSTNWITVMERSAVIPKIYCPREFTQNLTFPETEAEMTVRPLELCLQNDYIPVLRTCFENGTWSEISGKCSADVQISETTYELYNASEHMRPSEALEVLQKITENKPSEFTAMDVDLAANILKRAQEENVSAEIYTSTINNIMDIPRDTLAKSQELLNSTDQILYSIDRFIIFSEEVDTSFDKVFVRTVNTETDIVGLYITNGTAEFLPEDQFQDILNQEDFDVAIVIKNKTFHLTWFDTDRLFRSIVNDQKTTSSILSILIPSSRTVEVTIYFRQRSNESIDCSYWKYGYEYEKPIKGRWKSEGRGQYFRPNYYQCNYNHTTHLGLLIHDKFKQNKILDVITIIGSVMSATGASVIFITALTFRQWRRNRRNKLLLEIAACHSLLIIFFYISDYLGQGLMCITVGVILHYVSLVHFLCTLLMTWCYYRNYVIVFNAHLDGVKKMSALAWCLPVVVVTITGVFWSSNYDKMTNSSDALCYPKGEILKFAFLLPIAIILLFNLVVFGLIVHNLIQSSKFRKYHLRTHTMLKSDSLIKVTWTMFVMMGLTWIFGIAAIFSSVFLFIFCLLAPIQGFAMMIFFVLNAKETKQLWRKKLNFYNTRSGEINDTQATIIVNNRKQ